MFTGFFNDDLLRVVVEEFNATNDYGIFLDLINVEPYLFDDMLQTRIAAADLPDFTEGDLTMVTQNYSGREAYQPVDDYFIYGATAKDNFFDAALDLFNVDGEQWMLPFNASPELYYFWNKDLFAAAGFNPDIPAYSWYEAIEIAGFFSGDAYGMGTAFLPSLIQHMMLSEGVPLFDLETGTVNMEHDLTRDFLEKLRYLLYERNAYPPEYEYAYQLAREGRLAQLFGHPSFASALRDAGINYGIAPLPFGNAGNSGIYSGTGFAVFSNTDDVHKQALYKFIDYWYTDKNAVIWALDTSTPPFLKSAANSPDIWDDPDMSFMVDAVYRANAYNVNPPSGLFTNIFLTFNDILYGGADISAELEISQKELEAMLAR